MKFPLKQRGYGWKWRLAPAYDLTMCISGYNDEHATSVSGAGKPTHSDFIAAGRKIRLSKNRCRELIEEVEAALSQA